MKTKPKLAHHEPVGKPTYLPLVFGGAAFLYALFFFGAANTSRLAALARLLIPDVVISLWCGGSEGQSGVLDRVPILIAAAAIMAFAWAAGNLMVRWLRVTEQITGLENYVLSQLVGLATLSNFTLLVGLCGWLHYRALFAAIAMALIAAQAAVRWRERARQAPPTHTERSVSRDDFRLMFAGSTIAVPFLLAYLFGGLLPPWDFDVREYHLQTPKEWLIAGRISFLPHNVYGNMPLGAEMFAILGGEWFSGERAWWWGALAGKLIMALYAPLGALGLFAAGKRWWSPAAGVAAGLVYLSLPGILGNAIAGLNETPLATYVLLAVFATLRWSELAAVPERASAARSFLLLAGYLAGAAAGCKYPALMFLNLPLAVSVLCCPRSEPNSTVSWLRRLRWRECAVLVLASLAGGGLWYAKNWALAGNPVYPLAYNVFGGATRTPEKDTQWRHAVQVPGDAWSGTYGPHAVGAAAYGILLGSEQLSLVIWPAAIAAIFFFARDGRVRLVAMLAAYMFLTWWLFSHRIERFWLPYMPLVALLAGVALGALWNSRRGRLVAGALLVASLLHSFTAGALGLYAQAENEWQLAPYPYFVALEAQRTSPDRVNPFHLYLNEHRPPGTSLLLVGDAEPFDLEVDALYNTCFDDCLFEQFLRDRSPAERRAVLHEHNIAYIYVHWGHIDRYRSPGNYGFTNWVQPQVLAELVASGVLHKVSGIEASAWNGELYAVVP